jgi:hypothetical protein
VHAGAVKKDKWWKLQGYRVGVLRFRVRTFFCCRPIRHSIKAMERKKVRAAAADSKGGLALRAAMDSWFLILGRQQMREALRRMVRVEPAPN